MKRLALPRTDDTAKAVWFASALLMVLFVIMAFVSSLTQVNTGDIAVYVHYSHFILLGRVPYRDFSVEYLPGVIPFLALTMPLGLALGSLLIGFWVQTLAAFGYYLYHLVRTYRKKVLLITCLLLVPLLEFVFSELDIFSAVLLYAAVYMVKQRKYSLSAVALAFSTLIKTYPGVVIIGLLWAVPRGYRCKYIFTFLGCTAVVLLPFAIIAPEGILHAITYHSGRPLENGSSGAAIGYVMHIFGQPFHLFVSHSSWAADFPGQALIAKITTGCLALGLAAVAWLLHERKLKPQPALISMLLLMIFLLFFKVGSPQYLVCALVLYPLASLELELRQLYRLGVLLGLLSILYDSQFVIQFRMISQYAGFNDMYRFWAAGFATARVALLLSAIFCIGRLLWQKPPIRQNIIKASRQG